MGCPLAQGFLFAGPLAAADAERFLAAAEPAALSRPERAGTRTP
jgi:EAL domain-containing protein (putative c-di-GMP-specific phosphodiesterase class I)